MRGYELVLFVRAQNQASATLRRVAGDVRALTRATAAQGRMDELAMQTRTLDKRKAAIRDELRSIRKGAIRTDLDRQRATLMKQQQQATAGIQRAQAARAAAETGLTANMKKQAAIQSRLGVANLDHARAFTNERRNELRLLDRISAKELTYARQQEKIRGLLSQRRKLLRSLQVERAADIASEGALPSRVPDIERDLRRNLRGYQRARVELQHIDASVSQLRENLRHLPEGTQRALSQIHARRAGLEAQLAQASAQAGNYRRQMEAAIAAENTHSAQLARLSPQFQKLATAEAQAAARAKALQGELATLRGEYAALTPQIVAAERAMARQARAERLQLVGRTVSHIGRTAQFGGLIGTAALGATAVSAANLETSVSLAASQARDLDAPLAQIAVRADEIDDAVKRLMGDFPATAEEMSSSAYDIFSSIDLMNNGVTDMAKGVQLMDAANRVAVAGMENLDTATSALITVVNNFDPNVSNLNANLDTMFDIIRFGRMRLGEFDRMMNRVAPAARGAGQSLEDVGGAMAYLTTVIPSQQQVATGIQRLLQAFQHPDFVRGADELGFSLTHVVDGVEKLRPLPEIINEIAETFPELKEGGVFAENFLRVVTRAGRTARTGKPSQGLQFTEFARRALRLLLTGLDEYNARQEQVTRNVGEFGTAFNAQIDTAGNRWKIFVGQLRRSVLDIGEAVIPVFSEIGKHIGWLADRFHNLSPETRELIVKFAAFASIGALVGGLLLSIGGGLLALYGTLRIFFGARGLGDANIGRMAKFAGLLRAIQQIGRLGVIAVVLKTMWTGDASARDFLLGALAGAIAGSRFGPGGAVVGAITVPILLRVIEVQNERDAQSMLQRLYDTTPLEKKAGGFFGRLAKLQRDIFDTEFGRFISPFNTDEMVPDFRDKLSKLRGEVGRLNLPWDLIHVKSKEKWIEIANNAFEAGKITMEQYVAGMRLFGFSADEIFGQQMELARQAAQAARGMDKVEMERHLKAAAAARTAQKQIAKANKNAADSVLKAWDEYYDKKALAQEEAKKRSKDLARIEADAAQQAAQEVANAAANLTQTYQSLLQQNKSFFGELFGGEWLTGERAQVSEEWGIAPQIQDLTKDLQMQLDAFNNFNNRLAQVARRGAPAELIAELEALGPDALDKIEVLARAAPAQFNKFVAVWREKQKAIENATKIDFDKQLQQWFKYGQGIAQQIIFGLRSENVALDNAFRKYLTAKFPNYVNEAVAKARREAKEAEGPTTPMPKPPKKPDPRKQPVRTPQQKDEVNVNFYGPVYGDDVVDKSRVAAHHIKMGARKRKEPTNRRSGR